MEGAHDPYGALRHKDYRHLLAGSMLANIGGEIQATAVGWELYQRTDSAVALGLTGLAQFLPVLLLSLPAGQAADHYSRKRLLQAALGLTTLASLGLAALSFWEGPIPLVYLCLVLVGSSRAFNAPARLSLLPQVVPSHLLGNAVTWNSSGMQIAHVSGPAIGGLVIAMADQAAAPAYLIAAGCSLVCILLLIPIRPQAVSRPVEPRTLGSLAAGVQFVWRTKLLLAAITLDLFAVLLGGATALLPIFARDILKVGPTGLGWLRSAPALGAFVMALVLAHRPPLRHAGQTLLLAVAGFGMAMIGFGLSENALLSFVLLALSGALDNISVVVRHTLMQVLTPDAMRGRVAAVNLVFISSSNELGAFESGVTAQLFGPMVSVVVGGLGTIIVVLVAMERWPQLIQLGSLHAAAQEFLPKNDLPGSNPPGK